MSKHFFTLGAVASLSFAVAAPVIAASHSWDIVEVFSNSDGTIQFIELRECCGMPNENFLLNLTVTSTATGKQLVFTENLPPNSTANARANSGKRMS